ncbi:carboxylesterase [Sodiomyces alkalinus F11]|uniref:Carboxylic ester hydrolase n=1 Tax=Sodiomyces alkalinus (strain CBS 110278 / VKM F-3762 / F11) TaxID=1314773 RepID=A0A3N2PXU1_SODAK|nr:carboxylesterase [Sodiomyces alkalinus F11]ROT39353.1 carboxylesterase [Sodiomyces alkalinus F11]
MTTRPTVRLPQGTYWGTVLSRDDLPRPVEAFLGIPYARVLPGAEGRFRDAAPVPASLDTFEANTYGSICPTFTSSLDEEDGWVVGEDCLSVNLIRPCPSSSSWSPSERLPVVVFFHGGAFNFGKGADRDMASFVAYAEQPVLGISFNWRLGPLGFLPSRVCDKEGVLNLGLRDQRMLLEWVRDNVVAFGGDEGCVTLMGVSAGAHSIGHHILSSESTTTPLFHKAILESGSATARSVLSPDHSRHELQFQSFLRDAGFPPSTPDDAILSHLRSLPLSTLLDAGSSVWGRFASSVCWPFQPSIDGIGGVIPDLPLRLWSSGLGLRPPLITGFNSHEGTTFVPIKVSSPAAFRAFFQTLLPALTPSDLDELDRLYPQPDVAAAARGEPYTPAVPAYCGAQWARLATAYAHHAYIAPVLHTAHHVAAAGQPVYVYEYAARAEPFAAANHGDEGPVVARDMEALGGFPGLVRVSEGMHGFFSRFVASRCGDPNRLLLGTDDRQEGDGDVPAWPRFVSPFDDNSGPDAGKILVFGEGNDERAGGESEGVVARVRTLTRSEIAQCRFWWERMPLSQGSGRR